MKYNRSPGEDGITTECLNIGEEILLSYITNFFNTILKTGIFQIICEKYQEHNMPLYLAFVDYTKAFDSIIHTAIIEALAYHNIDSTYIKLIKKIYRNSTAAIK